MNRAPVVANSRPLSFHDRWADVERAIQSEYDPEKNGAALIHAVGESVRLFNALPAATRNSKSYHLHPAFTDWGEWQKVVLSTVKARARLRRHLDMPFVIGSDFLLEGLERVAITTGGFGKHQWDQIFRRFESDGAIPIDVAARFFGRLDDCRDNYKRGTAKGFFHTENRIVSHWVKLDAPPGEFPGCCALDNDSVALFIRFFGNMDREPMAGPNCSRKIKTLSLVKCRKATWKANAGKSCKDQVWVEPR